MGHDITLRLTNDDEPLINFRMTARKGKSSGIYKALGVPQFNNIDSGTGDSKIFSREELRKALEGDITVAEHDFIKDCIAWCREDGIKLTFA